MMNLKIPQVAPIWDVRKILKQQNKKDVSQITTVCCRRAVLFEVSFKSIYPKLLSLINIKNCFGRVSLIQLS